MQLTPKETDHAAALLVTGCTQGKWDNIKDEAGREKFRTLAKNMAAIWDTPRNADTLAEFFKWCAMKVPSPPPERKINARRQEQKGNAGSS